MIEYEITEEDHVNFNVYHTLNSPLHKKQFRISKFILPAILLPVIYFTGTLLFKQPSWFWIVTVLGFYIYWIYSYPKSYKKTIRKQSLKLINEGDNSSIYGKKKIEITDDQLIFVEADMTISIPKARVKEIKENDDMILLYLSAVSAQIIPKRYLSDKDLSDIRAILK